MRGGGVTSSVGSIVLGFEFIVVFLGALVAFGARVTSPAWAALVGGGVLVVLMLLAVPLLRFGWGVGFGWGVQILVLASGIFVHMMFAAGAIFIAIWAYAMYAATRADRQRAAMEAAYVKASEETPDETENPS